MNPKKAIFEKKGFKPELSLKIVLMKLTLDSLKGSKDSTEAGLDDISIFVVDSCELILLFEILISALAFSLLHILRNLSVVEIAGETKKLTAR